MKTKIQIKSVFGKVLFEFEKENNTIKDTLLEALTQNTDLRNANLRNANLWNANLRNANLWNANLRNADLRDADLRNADLWNANLRNANLRNADLRDADLRNADLWNADLWNADLWNADLKKVVSYNQVCPEEGSFVGWKKCKNRLLVKLEIPAKAKRVSPIVGRKCRASYVKTLVVYRSDKEVNEIAIGFHDHKTEYKKGKITKPDKYDNSPFVECSNGIHFFITKQEALDW